ncbi:VOC family protein, partial [Actinomadura kijaniata]|uniref:VOC family protein n=1 Tax=Actinomadura kijaniata TaxID=46161 RepID=UPI003F1BC660
PDPAQPAPERPRPFGIDGLAAPALVAWAVAVTDVEDRVARARAAGFDPGDAVPMARRRPDGVLLEWRLTPMRTGAAPFLIDWGRTEHPAAALPVVPLRTFQIVDPEPGRVRAALDALGVTADLRAGDRPALRAEIGDGLILE